MPNTLIQKDISPREALNMLKEGNFRFAHNIKQRRDLLKQVSETAGQQTPFAVIVSCMDSRTSNELIFDLGIGDIFSIRIAGNIINDDILGSLEFACKVATAKFIVILGHTACGAIKGACDDVKLGNLSTLLDNIKDAVKAESTVTENRTASNDEFTYKVAKLNTELGIRKLTEKSPILSDMLENGEIGVIAAMYNISSGVVEFYDETLVLKEK